MILQMSEDSAQKRDTSLEINEVVYVILILKKTFRNHTPEKESGTINSMTVPPFSHMCEITFTRTAAFSEGQTVTVYPSSRPSRHWHNLSGSIGRSRAATLPPCRLMVASLAVQRRKNASSASPSARRRGAGRSFSTSMPTGLS